METRHTKAASRPGLLLRLGLWPSVLLMTVLSITASVGLTMIGMWMIDASGLAMRTAMMLSATVPVPIAGMVTLVLMRLVRELEEARRQVHELAITDSLTGACNRRHFMELAEAEFIKACRYALPLSVLMLDADHFKKVNDQHGHGTGDEVLRAITRATIGSVRSADVVARYGGEEFVVLLPLTAAIEARLVAERVRAGVMALEIASADGALLKVTVSIGVATATPKAGSLSALLNEADQALYRAKAGGRNRVESGLPGAA